jgi:hypothetical protein
MNLSMKVKMKKSSGKTVYAAGAGKKRENVIYEAEG